MVLTSVTLETVKKVWTGSGSNECATCDRTHAKSCIFILLTFLDFLNIVS